MKRVRPRAGASLGLVKALGLVSVLFFSGCPRSSTDRSSETAGEKASEPASETPMPGSDRDEHGCIGSAGYRWCERTNQCERPWQLAKREGFEADAFTRWCAGARDRE